MHSAGQIGLVSPGWEAATGFDCESTNQAGRDPAAWPALQSSAREQKYELESGQRGLVPGAKLKAIESLGTLTFHQGNVYFPFVDFPPYPQASPTLPNPSKGSRTLDPQKLRSRG